jgi:hypothetical protein
MPFKPKIVNKKTKNPAREADNPLSKNDLYGAIHQANRKQVLAINPICVRSALSRKILVLGR